MSPTTKPRSVEQGHHVALEVLGKQPLIDLDLRLVEGTGAALAMNVVEAAARILTEVATFDEAKRLMVASALLALVFFDCKNRYNPGHQNVIMENDVHGCLKRRDMKPAQKIRSINSDPRPTARFIEEKFLNLLKKRKLL